MKRLILLLTFIGAFACSATAQDIPIPQTTASTAGDAVQQGNWLLGADIGSIGYNFRSDLFQIDILPRAGYFISDNAAVGTQAQLGLIAYNGGTDFRYGLTPFVRYYFPEGAAPTHRWFGEARVGFAGSSISNSDEDAAVSSVIGVSAGYAHFVAEHVALEGLLSYTRTHANIDVGPAVSGLSVGVGLQVYLPGRNR